MSWSLRFSAPIALPADVAAAPAWQTAVGALLLVGDIGGPTDFARIGLMQALYPRGAPVYDTVARQLAAPPVRALAVVCGGGGSRKATGPR